MVKNRTILFLILLFLCVNVVEVYAYDPDKDCNNDPSDGENGCSPPPEKELSKGELEDGDKEVNDIEDSMVDTKEAGAAANAKPLEAKTEQNIFQKAWSAIKGIFNSPTDGDPVLLSSGAYTSTVYDLQWSYHGLPLPLTRVYNENGRGTALGENWHLSLESHVVFGIDAQIRELAEEYNDYVSDSETKLIEWRSTATKWLNKISDQTPASHIPGPKTRVLKLQMEVLLANANAFEDLKLFLDQESRYLPNISFDKDLEYFKVQRDEYNRRLKIAEAHIQRNQYRGGYDSDAFVGNEYVFLVDETGTGILYEMAGSPDYNATTPYINTSIVNYYPQGMTFTADDPDADHLTMRSNGVLVREKADLSRWYYDIYGRVFRIENQFGKGYDLEYAPNSAQLVKITDDANRQITLKWSGGRLISVIDYAGRQVTYAYSGNHLIGVTDPDGDSSRYEYTSAGRMKKTIKPDNTFIELHYHIVDGKEVVVGTTDEEKARENFSYKVSNNEIVETTYTTPSGVEEVHQIKDHLVTRTTYADGSSHQRTYNINRQLTNETLRSGEELRYDYDTFGRIEHITYGDGSTEEMSYQNKGRQITRYLDRRGNITTYDYNSTNQLTSIRYPVTPGSSTEVFSYTSEGLLSSREVANNRWNYKYDNYGQPVEIKLDGFIIEKRKYDAAGNLTERIYADGIKEALTYSLGGALTELKVYGKDGKIGYREEYAYNNRKDRIHTTINNEIRDYFIYDRRHKLRHRIRGVDPAAPEPPVFADEADLTVLRRNYDAVESFTYRDDGKLTAWEVHGEKDLHRMEYDYHPDGSLKEEIVLFNGETIAHEHYHRTNGMLTGIFDGEGRGHIYEENTGRSERKKIAAILDQSDRPTPFRPSGQTVEEVTRWRGGLPVSGTGLEGEDLEWHYDSLGRFTGLKREGLMLDSRQYDLLGRLVYREETPGRGYEFTYDARGRLSSVEGPDGEVIEERSYNTQTGELQTVRDPRNGSETSYLFDSMGRLSKVIDPEGHSVSYKYDSYGRLVALTDQAGETWHREYDTLGQMTATMDPLGRRYEYDYDGLGQVREVETPLGVAYQYLYDSLGRLREMNKGGDKTVMSYDLSGNLTLRQLPTGRMETYRYNGLNHLIEYLPSSSVDASVVYRYLRRNDGLLTRETDPLGRQRTYRYDGQGRLIEEINQQNVSQHFAYNNQGEMTERRDFENNRHQFIYDDWGRVTQRLYNSQVEASYEYDTQGNLTRAVNEINGDALEYGYDRKGNLTSQKTAMGTTRYSYDGRGLKTREMRPNQIIDYSYDGRGNLISSKESLLARRKVTYEYNALGQETLRNISGGHIEQRHYDEWGRLKGITGHQIQYEKLIGPLLYGESYVYGPGDQKKFSTDLDGNITAYEYDGFDRLASVSYPYDTGKVYTDFEERLDLGLYPNGQGKPVRVYEEKIKEIMAQAREKYPDYKAANIDLESHLFAAPGGTVFRPWRGINPSEDDALEESYSDVFGVRRTRPQMVSYAWQEEFDYDDAGSRIQKRNGWGTIDYQYSEENRLRLAGKREYLHDKNGNLIQESSGGGLRRYEYNSQNRISQAIMNEGMARLLEYKYDGLGRRTEMSDSLSGTTRYGYEGLGLNPVEEDFKRRFNIKSSLEEHRNNFKQGETQPRESRGRGRYMPYPQDSDRRTSKKTPSRGLAFSVSETRSYLYKGLSPVASTAVGDKGGMRSEAYGHDALGSVTEVVQYGEVQASYRYDAFGKTYEGALSSGERGYNGKPYNAVTGHYNYGYRDYDPMTGRFATVDPIRDGMNWYVYTANDPVNYIDPWGLAAEDTEYIDSWRTPTPLQKFNQEKRNYIEKYRNLEVDDGVVIYETKITEGNTADHQKRTMRGSDTLFVADYAAPLGTPVYTGRKTTFSSGLAPGTVPSLRWDSGDATKVIDRATDDTLSWGRGFGRRIIGTIEVNGDRQQTVVAHLDPDSQVDKDFSSLQESAAAAGLDTFTLPPKVKIGEVGSTGNTTGPHLHYERNQIPDD